MEEEEKKKYVQKMFICLNTFNIFSCIVVEMCQYQSCLSLQTIFEGNSLLFYYIVQKTIIILVKMNYLLNDILLVTKNVIRT